MVQTFVVAPHPYYPQNVHIPGYVPNTSSLGELLVRFGGILSITVITALWLATTSNPRLARADKAVLSWFVLCEWSTLAPGHVGGQVTNMKQAGRFTASLKVCHPIMHARCLGRPHFFARAWQCADTGPCPIKGYFLYNHAALAGSQDLFAQLWKEYALSDSRYLTSDPFMLCVEAITVVCKTWRA